MHNTTNEGWRGFMRSVFQSRNPMTDPAQESQPGQRQDEVMIAYLPIVRGAAIAVLGYFLFDLISRFFFPGDAHHLSLIHI